MIHPLMYARNSVYYAVIKIYGEKSIPVITLWCPVFCIHALTVEINEILLSL